MDEDTVHIQISRATAHELVRTLETSENLTREGGKVLSILKFTLASSEHPEDEPASR